MAKVEALVVMAILGVVAHGVSGQHAESRLATYIKSQSDPDILPESSGPVLVYFSYMNINVDSVDREHNLVSMEGMSMVFWQTGITWNPADYGGLTSLSLPDKYLWLPPIQSMSKASKTEDFSPKRILLYNNGTAFHVGLHRPQVFCDVSHVDSGAVCNLKTVLWGLTKDEATYVVFPLPQEYTDNKYFAGSKYTFTGNEFNFHEFTWDGHVYQVANSTFVIQEKPHSHHHHQGGFRAVFEMGH